MSKRTVTHQIKLPLTLTIILGLIAFGLIANVLKPVLKIDEAFASTTHITEKRMKAILESCDQFQNGNYIFTECR